MAKLVEGAATGPFFFDASHIVRKSYVDINIKSGYVVYFVVTFLDGFSFEFTIKGIA